jgi:hypothetical protein
MSLLFLVVVRELYLDTDRPVDLSNINFDQFELEDVEDEELKLQGNMAFVFSQTLNYASSLIRFVAIHCASNGSTEWFDLRDRLLQERVQRLSFRVLS